MRKRQRKHMRVRKAILMALKEEADNSTEFISANEIIGMIAKRRDDSKRQIHSIGFNLPSVRTIGNLMRGWHGIEKESVYKQSNLVLTYRLKDLQEAQEWLGVTI